MITKTMTVNYVGTNQNGQTIYRAKAVEGFEAVDTVQVVGDAGIFAVGDTVTVTVNK